MPISLQCPACGANYNLPEQMAGKQAKCKCGQQIAVPFASPATASRPLAPAASLPTNALRPTALGLWQAGNLLVMSTKAQLPTHVCIKSGQPAASQHTQQLQWVPAWVAGTALAGRITHYAASESHGRKCTVHFGLSRGANLKRLLPLIAGYVLVGIGLLFFFGNIIWMFTFHQEGDPIPLIGFLLGGGIGVVGGIITQLVGPVLKATAMDNDYVVIRGVGPPLLATLPAWPGPVPEGKSQ
jgi:hypothetical protein